MAWAAAMPMVEVSTTWEARRPAAAATCRATCSDAAPSGRLSTTTPACLATSATLSAYAAPAGTRCGPAMSCATTG